MKAKLEFDLDNPDDKEQFVVASTAQDWYMALYVLDQQLRTYLKYGHDFKSADDALEDLREKLWEFMEDYNVNFNMLS